VPSNPDPKTSRLPLMGLVAVTVCLAAIPAVRPRQDVRVLGGTWLMTLAFAGERPLLLELAFTENESASMNVSEAHAHWRSVAPNKFSVQFDLPAEGFGSGGGYRVNGVLTLDELGRLRGPLSADVIDPEGKVITSLRGAAKARFLKD
jgi:hypothetical protein